MSRLPAGVATCLLWCLAVAAQAYEPGRHEVISAMANRVYQYCYPGDYAFHAPRWRERVIQGNRGMDEGLDFSVQDRLRLQHERVFLKARRVFNWHFYHPGRQDLARVGKVDQSMVRLWQALLQGLEDNFGDFDRAWYLGGLMHLLEDITVPAHAVPVYHGPTAIKFIGPFQFPDAVNYMEQLKRVTLVSPGNPLRTITDAVDSFAIDEAGLGDLLLNPGTCAEFWQKPQHPDHVRDWAQAATLAALDEPIPGCPEFSWGHFWLMPEEGHYFGRYNLANGQPLFGEAGRLLGDMRFCDMRPNDQRYRQFVQQLHVRAVLADVHLMLWYREKYL